MNSMTYKDYTTRIEFDDRDNIFVGQLLGIRDIICFHADNIAQLREAFEEAVEDYLESCEKIGKTPEKPAHGTILRCVPSDIHASAQVAQSSGKHLNQQMSRH